MARIRIDGLCRGELERKHRNVVFLAKGLRDIGDLLRRFSADGASTLKAEELAGWRLGFDNSVGEEGEGVARGKPEAGFCVFGIDDDAERQAGGQRNFLAVVIGSQMAGVGEGDGAIRVNAVEMKGEWAVQVA